MDVPTPPTQGTDVQVSDADLLARFRAGDGPALDALLERYESVLFPFLLGILKDHHQAEDALQETWCRALQHVDRVDWAHLRGWLFTVAYHEAMLIKRRQKTRQAEEEGQGVVADAAPGPLQQAEQREELLRLRQLLERLPPAQREVIRRRIYEGQRFRDIAEELSCPLNTALARMHEGLKRLRLLYGADHA
jgi:RNA polymerase sigma-70 factor (ECF subfamily)